MPPLAIPRRRDITELMDNPSEFQQELPANLRDIRLLNRWLGGTRVILQHLDPLVGDRDEFSLLDVATGSADIPRAIYRRERRRGIRAHITGLDISPEILAEARRFVPDGSIHLVRGDALALPWPDESFDFVTFSLALHHFSPEGAGKVLRELWRVARTGVLVSDVRREYLAFGATWLIIRTLTSNRLTRHDAPSSVLRAYTPEEVAALAVAAGYSRPRVYRHVPFRQVLVARKEDASG